MHLTDETLRPIGQLLSSTDEAIHRQGLELLETLAPAAPDALRGAVIHKLPRDLDLTNRDLAGARLRSTYQRRDLHGSCLIGASLISSGLPSDNLSGADLRFARIHNRWSQPYTWRSPWLTGACLRGATLSGIDLHGMDMHAAKLKGIDLRGADLSGADLRGGRFSGLDLSGVDLSGANLKGANLKGTRLVGADLSGATLFRVNLKGADLTGAILTFDDTIRWDKATRWPAGQAPAPGTFPSRRHPRYRDRGA